MNERNMWIYIITKLYKDLHTSDRVMHSSSESDKKRDRILKYFDRLEKIHQKVAESKNKNDLKILENFYHNLYVIKPEDIPDSYFEREKQIMRERGYGDIEITSERKQILTKQIIEDQEESLDKWIEYFLFDEESKSYEIWEKYWVFQGLQQLGKFNKETGKFSKRDKHTVYPFPPVEREVIFTTLKLMEDYIKDRKGDNEIRSALGSGNFKTLYEYSIKMIMNKGEKKHSSTEGKWVKYEQGSDYHKLRDSLQGYYTGWCTAAGENFAKGQLENGDFYVYYTLDESGEAKVPRIAIRMDGHDTIGEIRGIADNQNLEPEMMPILDKKLEEFPDRDKYRKKEYDMQFLTTIDNKVQKGYDLTEEELRFLYEIDDQIEGFGYRKDPRIEEIKNKRNIKQDIAQIFNCIEDEVSIGKNMRDLKEIEGKKVHYGFINLSHLTSAKGLKLPEIVVGDLDLSGLTSAKSLKLPQKVAGDFDLSSLTSAEGLKLPENIGGSLYLYRLTSAKGLEFPKMVGKNLYLYNLANADGVKLPEIVGGNIFLSSLTSAKGLEFPKMVGESLYLNSLTSAKGLVLPQKVVGDLDLSGLTSAKSLKLPQKVAGDLILKGLKNAKGLVLPQKVVGDLDLSGLTSAKSLKLPQKVVGDLILKGLKNAKGLVLPEIVGGNLSLIRLTSAKGLVLPQKVGGYLDLYDLKNAYGVKLPEIVGGSLSLNNLTSAKGLVLPQKVGGDLDLYDLKNAHGVKLPEIVGGYLGLNRLTSAEGLVLPENISLERVVAPDNIIEEIEVHPEKYFKKHILKNNDSKNEKYLSNEKEKIVNAKHFTEETKNRLLEDLAQEMDNYNGENQNEYKGKHFK